jgi:DNA repair protein RadC
MSQPNINPHSPLVLSAPQQVSTDRLQKAEETINGRPLSTADNEGKRYRIPVYKVSLVRERSLTQLERPQIRDASGAAATLAAYLAEEDREHFVVLLLNSKNRLIGINTVSIGSLTSSLAHPREVFKPAILANAAAIIVAHNHPSGEPTPSQDDVEITKRLHAAAELLGIRLLDHIVLGDNGRWYSFQDDGLLTQRS